MERDIPVVIVDYDKSKSSRELSMQLDANELLFVIGREYDLNTAHRLLEHFQCMAIIIIPDDYEKKLKIGQQAKISIAINNTRFMITNDIVKGISDVLSKKAGNSISNYFKTNGLTNKQGELAATPLCIINQLLFNTTESYGDFMIVALLALILQQTLLIGVSVSMAHENESNRINELITMAHGSISKIIIGKTGFYYWMYCAYAFLFFTLHFAFYKLPLTGSFTALLILVAVHFLCVIIIGLFIATYIPSKLLAIFILVFVSYPVLLLSGYSWPLQAFPILLKSIALMIPSTPFFQAYTAITQGGATFSIVMPQIIHITLILVLVLVLFKIRISYLHKNIQLQDKST
jgi:ABC-2 type transport system permease protein